MELVSILASFCVWTKSIICKDAANRNSIVQSEVRRISKFPVSRLDDVSSRPDAHLSSAPSVWTMCHPVGRQTVQHHPSGRRASSVLTLHCIEKFLCQLALSGRFSSTSKRLSVLKRFTNSFQVPRNGRSINRPDDVVYRPDAYLRKARIAVQNEPSGHLTAVVRTLVHRIW
jgi:hypothetical protein